MSDLPDIASTIGSNETLDLEGLTEAVQSHPFHETTTEKRPSAPGVTGAIETLMDVTLQLTVELGNTQMTVRQVLDLQKGSVIELNRVAGDAVDVFVNGRLIAKGEVVVVDDKFGVRVTDIAASALEEGEKT